MLVWHMLVSWRFFFSNQKESHFLSHHICGMHLVSGGVPPKNNMRMEHPPFEDVFLIENGNFPMSC